MNPIDYKRVSNIYTSEQSILSPTAIFLGIVVMKNK